ncbi:MAG TPA: 3-oxoacyl-[acyl-carrier-protein] synthase III C-terminal domain-containing protein [Acidisarcina sp.]
MSDLSTAHNTVIESLGVYLPSEVASTREVLAGCNFSRFQRGATTRIERVMGIQRRRLAADTEPASEMAKKAIQNCMAASRCQPSEIDLVLYCSISRYGAPNHYISEPAISLVLTSQYPFPNALALDISNGCAGMFTAISIADSLIKSGLIRTALIVSGEHITDLLKTAQKETTGYTDSRFACLTLGDAAAAVILKEGCDDRSGFHALDLYTVAQFSEYCIGKPSPADHGGIIMYTESAKLFEVAENYVIPDIVRALETRGWGRQELDHLISHQTAQRAIDKLYEVNRLSRCEVLHEGNVINNLPERGNTASTSHFVALWDNIQNGRIRSGERILFAVQGSGMTIGTAAYSLDDLPERVHRAARNGHVSPAASSQDRRSATLQCGAPRVRIESLGIAHGRGFTSSMSLAQRAMDDCLATSSYSRDDIELLIYAGVHRDEFIGEPAIAALIAGRTGMNATGGFPVPGKKTFAFDVYNGTMGFLNACYLGAGMIRAGRVKSAMVVAAEIEPNATRPEWDQMGIAAAGSAVILDKPSTGPAGLGHCVFESFPDHIGALASWLATNQETPRMHITKDSDLEAIYLKCIPRTVEELLKCESLCMEDIKVVLPPQISRNFVPALADALRLRTDRFVDLLVDNCSLSSSSLAHSFLEVRRRGRVAAGDIGLMISVGSGLQVGAATYYF